jgi:hypothetical protein
MEKGTLGKVKIRIVLASGIKKPGDGTAPDLVGSGAQRGL